MTDISALVQELKIKDELHDSACITADISSLITFASLVSTAFCAAVSYTDDNTPALVAGLISAGIAAFSACTTYQCNNIYDSTHQRIKIIEAQLRAQGYQGKGFRK